MSRLWDPPKSCFEKDVDGLSLEDVSQDTLATSSHYVFTEGPETVPLVPPVCHSSTYKLKSVEDYLKIIDKGGYVYARFNDFTSDNVQCVINDLEKGAGTLVFNTGMASISTAFFTFLKAGDHIVVCNPCYTGVYAMAKNIFPQFNVEVTFVPAGCPVDEYRTHIKSNTRMLYSETPCNPTMAILDLREFGKLGQSLDGVLTMVDGTFASPYLQHPLEYGIDISMHSCTKYMGGDSDLTAGSLTFRTKELCHWFPDYLWELPGGLYRILRSPHDASLLLRGLKTLPLRMERHSSNGQKVAEFLKQHSKIEAVMYPGLPSHPHHAIAKKQMKRFGGVESVIEHPATMTHGPMGMNDEDRRSGGISEGLVRLSVGLEDPGDLIRDLKQALNKVHVISCIIKVTKP